MTCVLHEEKKKSDRIYLKRAGRVRSFGLEDKHAQGCFHTWINIECRIDSVYFMMASSNKLLILN